MTPGAVNRYSNRRWASTQGRNLPRYAVGAVGRAFGPRALADGRPAETQAVLLWQRHYYHQQYLSDAKNPNGYCGIGGTGVTCPIGTGVTPSDV